MLLIPLLALFYLLTAHTAQTSKQARTARRPAQLAQVIEAESPTCTVTAMETLNLRESDSTSSAVIAILKHGESVTVIPYPAQDPWIKVQAQDLIGFLNSNYCEKEK